MLKLSLLKQGGRAKMIGGRTQCAPTNATMIIEIELEIDL